MTQILSKTIIKLMTSSLAHYIKSLFVFGVKVQLFTILSIFREINLKFGGGSILRR